MSVFFFLCYYQSGAMMNGASAQSIRETVVFSIKIGVLSIKIGVLSIKIRVLMSMPKIR